MNRLLSKLGWLAVALVGAGSLGAIALSRGEPVNGLFFVLAAGGTYLVAYRFYSAFIAARVLTLDGTRATPAERLDDGRDFVPTNRWVVLGHHFAAIAGPGPLVGPTLAAQFGYLPGTLWLVAGAVLGGCVQDFVILFFSLRRDGRSLGQIARDEVGRRAGLLTMVSVLAIMIILLAVVALVVVNALKHSPWGAFTLAMTIPIALLMGVYMRYLRPGRVLEASAIGLALVMFAVVAGQWVAESAGVGAGLHAHRPGAGTRRDRLRLRRLGAARVAAARAARLLVGLHQGGRRARARGRHPAGAADDPDAGAHALHRRQRPGLRGCLVPLLLHHDRLRCRLRLPCAHLLRHDAEAADARERRAPRRLRLDADGVVRRRDGDGRGLRARARRLLRDQQPRRGRRRHRRAGRGHHLGLGLRARPGHDGPPRRERRRADAAQPHRRRALARRRHGPHLQRHDRRRAAARHLVPLRDHVRGALHPDRARRRHARGPLHGPGAGRPLRPRARAHGLLDQHARHERCDRGRLGLFPLPGCPRPARRHQQPVAAVRHRQPDPGLGGAGGGHHDPDQDGPQALRLDHARADGVARGHGDAHGRRRRSCSTTTRASASCRRRGPSSCASPRAACPRRSSPRHAA